MAKHTKLLTDEQVTLLCNYIGAPAIDVAASKTPRAALNKFAERIELQNLALPKRDPADAQ